ncbi:MAG: aminodeoxychorismate synthase component I [Myxococcota bacterium]|nr:aminodeoxychorismate synthase component I [Myxococcota bacterium]
MPPDARLAVREIPAPPRWEVLRASVARKRGAWLLESALVDGRLGRWSFAGAAPCALARSSGDRTEIEPLRADATLSRRTLPGDPFEALRALVPRAADVEVAPPFAGGAVGWLGYECAAHVERVAVRGSGGIGVPDAAWLLVDRVLAFDHATGRAFATALDFGGDAVAAERAAERLAARIARGEADPFEAGARTQGSTPADAGVEPLTLRDPATGLALGAFFDADSYAKAVQSIREEILAGEVYQANLTHRLAATFGGDAWQLYETLRARSPAPFAAFLAFPELCVVGSSPERFVRVEPGGRVESRPIKGTRPRGATPDGDARLRAALAASEKDRAENAMIVDLVRNDLGRVCVPGSIEVPELFAIEAYATLFQMVSTVQGRLRPGADRVDLLRAAFPAGSMTGAPKIAAIDLLAKLEPVPRGVYAGALGWIDARGGADLCVVIRTLLCRGRRAWLHAGGGIVLDSDPRAEWEETRDKARAMIDALAACQEEPRP